MRKAAVYPAPRYHDPSDTRMVEIIERAERARPGAVNLLGVPFDGAVLGRRGAAGGPGGIRNAMLGFSNYNVELGVGLRRAKVFDLGDLVFREDDVIHVHSEIEQEVASEIRKNALLVVLGGDNSISLPSIRACSKKLGNLGLIVVDSHLDLRGKIDGKPTSGSSYGLAIEDGFVQPERVVELGAHGFLNSKDYFEKAQKLGIAVITAKDVAEKGAKAASEKAYRIASKATDAVYISVDLDAVDLAHVSGVSAPSAGGITANDLFTLAYELGRKPGVAVADIVELAPSLDPTGRSERVAATALTYLIAGFVSRKRTRAV